MITDASGNVVERDSYDAWGKRRNPDGTAAACGTISSATTRGFTGQEMMDSTCLINFNARIYDPSLGRFMSADPTAETVYNLQILNRFSYVGNNPLSLTDPSGLCFLGCFWHSSIFKAVLSIAVAILAWEYLPALILSDAGITATSGVVAAAAGGNVAAASALAISAGIAGGLSGAISTGTLQGALLGAVQGLAFYGVGNLLQGPAGFAIFGSHDLGALVAHGFVGGLFSVAQGGNFGSGFIAAGLATFAPTPVQGEDFEEVAEGTVESAILGGIGSELGGGKFQNGAITGAFGYLFNEASHPNTTPDPCSAGANSAYGCTTSTNPGPHDTGDCIYGCNDVPATKPTLNLSISGAAVGYGGVEFVFECNSDGSCYEGVGVGAGESVKGGDTSAAVSKQFYNSGNTDGLVIQVQGTAGAGAGVNAETYIKPFSGASVDAGATAPVAGESWSVTVGVKTPPKNNGGGGGW